MVSLFMPNPGESDNTSAEVITEAQMFCYDLPLRTPWTTAKGQRVTRQGWLIRLKTSKGTVGYGDCAPIPEMGTETRAQAEQKLRTGLNSCIRLPPSNRLKQLDSWHDTPAARCGLETALIDLISKQAKLPVARWLNAEASKQVNINAVIGQLDNTVQKRATEALEKGFRVLKIKMGIEHFDVELNQLIALASKLPEMASFRLDANGCWDYPEAKAIIKALADLPVESLEEPLVKPDVASLKRLQSLIDWPLALDESLTTWPHQALFSDPPVKRIVLKPMLHGGILPTLKIAKCGLELGMECVVSTTIDSAAGIWAAVHLAAALPGISVHGLNTSVWLAHDIGPPPPIHDAHMSIRNTPGLGFTPY